jgi:3-deoxy-D-manno-octulosonic-acid transferase
MYIADTLGELGLFYRLCKNVVMGGTFADIGGHNPIEPAQLGCLVFSGPVTYNFITITEDFRKQNALVLVENEDTLAERLARALENPAAFAGVADAARAWTQEKSHVVDEIAAVFAPLVARAKTGGGSAA